MSSYTPASKTSSFPNAASTELLKEGVVGKAHHTFLAQKFASRSAKLGRYLIPLVDGQFRQNRLVWAAAVFLVSVPVFIQAPLVRVFPWLSLAITLGWLGLSVWLQARSNTRVWGDLMVGFTWTWFAGSIYWGWLRWEPFLHLPVESIGLPFILFSLVKLNGQIGSWFYLGSLFGTAMTDLYFYLVDLIPYWRELMQAKPEAAVLIFQNAAAQMHHIWGIGCAVLILGILFAVGVAPLRSQQLHWWAFSGAVLSTIFVDGLFWLAAITA